MATLQDDTVRNGISGDHFSHAGNAGGLGQSPEAWQDEAPTALLVLADGTVLEGIGFGALGEASGEVCFNTAITGYQEILTDPSYLGQIVTFTFPHIGNIGINDEDIESLMPNFGASAVIVHAKVTEPSNWRSTRDFDQWLKARGIIGLSGIDTRALAIRVREQGMINAVIAHDPDGRFDVEALRAKAAALPSMAGLDLVPAATTAQRLDWSETSWAPGEGYGRQEKAARRVVAIDYGVKRNILRLLADRDCEVIVLPATTSAQEVLSLNPDGIFLSNGPGDPAATAPYAVPVIRDLLESRVPLFGICFGHQLLGLATGAQTIKMSQGHHGANHPVKDTTTGKVEIVSMNHGFAVDAKSLPAHVRETHVSLFDGSNCGIALTDRPAFSVQHHPEASPGPQDSHYLFDRFIDLMDAQKVARI